MGPGSNNDITDVSGIKVGQAHDANIATGVTVIVPDEPSCCSVDVRGGGPGTREAHSLSPETLVDRVDAIVLSGGSVYGLGAADGVASALGAQGRGFSLVPMPEVPVSPIVPAAILYDLANGGEKDWGEEPPYRALGKLALNNIENPLRLGKVGAGFGAQAGPYPGGVGSASYITEDGWEVGAIAAVNSFGSPYMPDGKTFWAWPFEIKGEFGNRKPSDFDQPIADLPPDTKIGQATPRTNTTIATIAVNAKLDKAQAKRIAMMAQSGMARALRPVHAPTDGDVVFCIGTGKKELPEPTAFTITRLGNIAADCLARAIARGVYEAEIPSA